MKPELSFAATASLPSDRANPNARWNVSAEVVTVRTHDLPLLHELAERFLDPRPRLVPHLLGHVPHGRVVTRRGSDLGDPASHQPRAQHANPFDVGHVSLS